MSIVFLSAACSPGESATTKGGVPNVGSTIPVGWPEGAPYITGIITQLSDESVRIEERPTAKGGSPKAVVTVDETTIMRGIGGAPKPRLRLGQRVSAWIGPRVRESYPVMGKALAIQIVEDTTSATRK